MINPILFPKGPGVYKITNDITGDCYIGSSMNLYKRMNDHLNYKNLKMFGKMPIGRAYNEYGIENFTSEVVKETGDFQLEIDLIKNLKPTYNISTRLNKNKPNQGKKFSQEWIDKLGKCSEHKPETKKLLTQINKEGATRLKVSKDGITKEFNSVKEAQEFTGCSWLSTCYKTACGWTIEPLKLQKKVVSLQSSDGKVYEFPSSYECDRFLNLWRGATSNAIKNRNGNLSEYKVEYKNATQH